MQSRLAEYGVAAPDFASRLSGIAAAHARRVREGDMDHLVFYLLQSSHFTTEPRVEPALAARAYVESRPAALTAPVARRLDALLRAVDGDDRDPRLAYFRRLLDETPRGERRPAVTTQIERTLRFLYEQEFGARGHDVARLYQSRGLSTDSASEAGYAVYAGLAVLKALDPSRRVRRVLIVGPGLDLAPRTGLIEDGPPESYQPWMVADALVSLGLSSLDTLRITAADINPRVVDHLQRASSTPPVLRLVTGLAEDGTLRLSSGYREYFENAGKEIARVDSTVVPGRLARRLSVTASAAAIVRAEPLDVVTERLAEREFDLIVATNVLVYFDRVELLLALSNMSAMLAADGVLLHNEVRPGLAEDAARAGVPLNQSRQLTIATVAGAPPLTDAVFLHRRVR